MTRVKMMAMGAILLTGSAAWGEVAYDNFGPGDSYQLGVDHFVVQATTTNFGGLSLRHGQQFVSGATGTANTFKLVIGLNEGLPQITLRLYNDSGSNELGTQIGSDFTGTFTSGTISILDISGVGWNLVSGETYWVTAQAAVNSEQIWAYSNSDTSGMIDSALGANGTSHNYVPAGSIPLGVFAIEVVPAPASVALLGLGGLVAARRRR